MCQQYEYSIIFDRHVVTGASFLFSSLKITAPAKYSLKVSHWFAFKPLVKKNSINFFGTHLQFKKTIQIAKVIIILITFAMFNIQKKGLNQLKKIPNFKCKTLCFSKLYPYFCTIKIEKLCLKILPASLKRRLKF